MNTNTNAIAMIIAIVALLGGCATDSAPQRAGQALIGTLVGAAGGALIGSVTNGPKGAQRGAKLGAVAGAAVGWNSPPPGSMVGGAPVPQQQVAAPFGGVGDTCWQFYPHDSRRRMICAENARRAEISQRQRAERAADREAAQIGASSESWRYPSRYRRGW